jgi:UDP-glucuronate decarboxylase
MTNKLYEILRQDAVKVSENLEFLSVFSNKKVLITGASGLVGLNMISFFDNIRGHVFGLEVVGLIRSSRELLLDDFRKRGIQIKAMDLMSKSDLASLGKFDYIIHAATYGQPGRFMAEKLTTMKLNTTALFNIFELLKESGTLLNISSSEIYSGSEELPYKETSIGTTTPMHPRSCYIEGKRAGETIVNIYRENGISASSVRLGVTYGPGVWANDQRVVNQLITRALMEKKLVLLDGGQALRNYIYVSDAIEIMINVLRKGGRPVYNVGGQSSATILNLAEKIGEIVGVKVKTPRIEIKMPDAPKEVSLDLSSSKEDFQFCKSP